MSRQSKFPELYPAEFELMRNASYTLRQFFVIECDMNRKTPGIQYLWFRLSGNHPVSSVGMQVIQTNHTYYVSGLIDVLCCHIWHAT